MVYLFMNGDIISKEEALISPFDHGFFYGMGLFETFGYMTATRFY